VSEHEPRRKPGEIRELESTVKVVVSREHASRQLDGVGTERLVIGPRSVGDYLDQRHLGFGEVGTAPAPLPTAARRRPEDLTLADIAAALKASGGNKTRAAAALGIAVNTLKARMKGAE
jgi:DNA-binding NtrC family response regulator